MEVKPIKSTEVFSIAWLNSPLSKEERIERREFYAKAGIVVFPK